MTVGHKINFDHRALRYYQMAGRYYGKKSTWLYNELIISYVRSVKFSDTNLSRAILDNRYDDCAFLSAKAIVVSIG